MKKVTLTEVEWRVIVHALNRLRNDLISEGRHTDVVDEVIVKIINAPVKRRKIA